MKINHSFQINSLLKITPHTHTPFLGELFCGVLKTITNHFYPLANEVAKGYSNATVRPSVTSL